MDNYNRDKRRMSRAERNRRRRRKRLLRRIVILAMTLFLAAVILLAVAGIRALFSSGDKAKSENAGVDQTNSQVQKNDEMTEESSAVITLEGSEPLQILLGEEFHEPGYTAKDKDGTDLTGQVQTDITGLNRAGEQQVVYTVEGKNGVAARAVRPVEVLPNTEYETKGLPICMYHYVYDPAAPPEDLNSNYISTENLAAEMKYLHENDYYFPTWQEVRDYVDGKLLLPEKSIVLTFDDGPNYMELGIPVLEQYETPATSFVIACYWDSSEMLKAYSSEYLRFESHSYQMHQGGGTVGHGGIYTSMTEEEIIQDLEKSFEICGNRDAFAYPFGDYTVEGCSALEKVGLLCAVTTENSRCYPGDSPYMLSRVRMLGEQSLDEFISLVE